MGYYQYFTSMSVTIYKIERIGRQTKRASSEMLHLTLLNEQKPVGKQAHTATVAVENTCL